MKKLESGMYVRTCKYGIGKVEICNCSMCHARGYLEPRIIFKNHTEYITEKQLEEIYAQNATYDICKLIKVTDLIVFKENIDNFKKEYILRISNLELLHAIIEKIKTKELVLCGVSTYDHFNSNVYRIGDESNDN